MNNKIDTPYLVIYLMLIGGGFYALLSHDVELLALCAFIGIFIYLPVPWDAKKKVKKK